MPVFIKTMKDTAHLTYYLLKDTGVGMMLAGYACVHQGYERHSPLTYSLLKDAGVDMMLAGGACVH